MKKDIVHVYGENSMTCISLDKTITRQKVLFLHKNIRGEYSLKIPRS